MKPGYNSVWVTTTYKGLAAFETNSQSEDNVYAELSICAYGSMCLSSLTLFEASAEQRLIPKWGKSLEEGSIQNADKVSEVQSRKNLLARHFRSPSQASSPRVGEDRLMPTYENLKSSQKDEDRVMPTYENLKSSQKGEDRAMPTYEDLKSSQHPVEQPQQQATKLVRKKATKQKPITVLPLQQDNLNKN